MPGRTARSRASLVVTHVEGETMMTLAVRVWLPDDVDAREEFLDEVSRLLPKDKDVEHPAADYWLFPHPRSDAAGAHRLEFLCQLRRIDAARCVIKHGAPGGTAELLCGWTAVVMASM